MGIAYKGWERPGRRRRQRERHDGRFSIRGRWVARLAAVLVTLLAVGALGACGGGEESSGDTGGGPVVALLYVATTGSDANDGTADAPLLTLPTAIAAGAALIGSNAADAVHVRVAGGTYIVDSDVADGTHVVLSEGVSLFGGFNPADWAVRDAATYTTTIADQGTDTANNLNPNRALHADSGITTATVVDGFTITGAAGDYSYGMYLGGAPTVKNNIIGGGTASVGTTGVYINATAPLLQGNTITAGSAGQNYGVQVQNGGTPTLTGNTIQGGAGNLSFALMTFNSAPVVTGNTLHGGTATQSRGFYNGNGTPTVTGNRIDGGDAGTQAVAVLNSNAGGTGVYRNNVILAGTSADPTSGTTRGLSVEGGSHPVVEHNTVDGGSGGQVAYAATLSGGSGGTFRNNILFTTGGNSRYCMNETADADEPDAFLNNALFDCATALYRDNEGAGTAVTSIGGTVTVGVATTTLTGLGNVADAAVFVGATDWHLHPDTPAALRKGGLDLTATVAVDRDGTARTVPVSMGAYEQETGSLLVQAASGGTVSASGTWVACYTVNGGAMDKKDVHIYDGESVTLYGYEYSSSDGSCSAGETLMDTVLGSVTVSGTVTAAAWTDSTSTQPAPTATGGGSLPATPDFSVLSFTGTFNGTPVADAVVGGHYIDDTGAPWRIFRTNRNPFTPCSSDGTGSGDEWCLLTVDILIKQP